MRDITKVYVMSARVFNYSAPKEMTLTFAWREYTCLNFWL